MIFLYIGLGLVGFYLILKIIGFIFVLVFKRILKLHCQAMVVVLRTKYDNITRIFDILKQLNFNFDPTLYEKLSNIKIDDFFDQQSAECKKAKEVLSILRDEALFIIKNDENLSKHILIKKWKENLKEIDNVYRNDVAMYNADVLGYNYWIHFLPNRLFFKIIKAKEKQIIS